MKPIVPLLVAFAGGVAMAQEDMKLDCAPLVYRENDTTLHLEVAYEIPYPALVFLREDEGFTGRYRIILEVRDKKGNPLSANVWERTVRTKNYRATVTPDSSVKDVVGVSVPAAAHRAELTVLDLSSDRRGWRTFPLERESGPLVLHLRKSGVLNPSARYRLNDTVEIVIEKRSDALPGDTVRLVVKKGERGLMSAAIALDSSGQKRAGKFLLPVADSTGSARFGGGEYTLEAQLIPAEGPSTINKLRFFIDLPFYYDDSAWQETVDRLLYIANPEEQERMKRTPRSERESVWTEFWRPKDPNPSTPVNEKEEEYFARIRYCDEHFARGDRGYKSDRARIYVQYGPPDQIESHPFDIDRPAEEIWYYYEKNLRFVFVDRFGCGEFLLSGPGRR